MKNLRSKTSSANRRQFLLASSAAVTAAALTEVAARAAESAAEKGGIRLEPSGRDLFRVRVEIEVEGNVNIPKNALVSRKTAMQVPIKSEATLDYEERFRRPPGATSGEVTMAERYYHEATSRSEVNRSEYVGKLRESVREAIVRREMLPEVIYCADDYLQRDELELLRMPVSSIAVEQLLPAEPVVVGTEYKPSREAIVSVLNMTSVEQSDVTAKVVAINKGDARIEFRGKVMGSVDGVPTEVRTAGKLVFDREQGICTWLAIGIHETREIGLAEPGFDIAATIKMVRKPLPSPIALSSPPKPVDVTAPIPQDRLYVELASDHLGFSALMDRRWRMMSDVPGAAMMRMVEMDRSVAQCDVRPLATLPAGVQWTLEAFQQDVRRTLGEQLSDLIEAEESLSPAGMRVLRLVARGSVQGVPIQWVLLHFSDDSGRRLLATFTMEGQNVATFAGADTQLAATLGFRQSATSESSQRQASREAAGQEVARAKPSDQAGDEVQSVLERR